MSSREFRPPEEKTSPVLFFVIGILMVAVTFWVVWDEIFTRRPWKNHQVEFNQMEIRSLSAKLAKSREKFGSKIAKLDTGPRIYEVGISYSGRTYAEGKKVNWKDGFRAVYCIVRYNLFP